LPPFCHGETVPELSLLLVVLVAWVIVFAPLASWLARQRARPWVVWGLFGAVLGPAAAALLVMAPPGRCPVCGSRIVGWPQVCQTCGRDLRSQPIEIARENAARRASLISAPIDSIGGPSLDPVTTASLRSREPALPPARPATALGLRPPAVSAPFSLSPPPLAALPLEAEGGPGILGSGVFVGGSESLQVGSRYLFARVGDDLHALGPVHVSPATIAARVPLGGVEPSFVEDRLLLAPAGPGRGPELAFGGVRLERNVDIVRELRLGAGNEGVAEPPWIPDGSVDGRSTRAGQKKPARTRSARASAVAAQEAAAPPELTLASTATAAREPTSPGQPVAARRPQLAIQAGPYVLRARVIIAMALAVGLMAAGLVSLIGR
jgi:hypothetical protein